MATNKEQFNNDMNALSNAINEKTGGTEPMTVSEMTEAVKSITGGDASFIDVGIIPNTIVGDTESITVGLSEIVFRAYEQNSATHVKGISDSGCDPFIAILDWACTEGTFIGATAKFRFYFEIPYEDEQGAIRPGSIELIDEYADYLKNNDNKPDDYFYSLYNTFKLNSNNHAAELYLGEYITKLSNSYNGSSSIYMGYGGMDISTDKDIYINNKSFNKLYDDVQLLKGNYDLIDNSSEYTYNTIVPSGVSKYAFISQVGGMSYKSNNLFNCGYEQGNINLETGDFVDDGYWCFSNDFIKVSSNTTYSYRDLRTLTISQNTILYIFEYDEDKNFIQSKLYQKPINNNIYFTTFTTQSNTRYVRFTAVIDGSATYIPTEVTLVKGKYTSSTLNYIEYFDGIRHSKVANISHTSGNLLQLSNVAKTTTNGITYSVKDGVITLNGTATKNMSLYCFVKELLKTPINSLTYNNTVFITGKKSETVIDLFIALYDGTSYSTQPVGAITNDVNENTTYSKSFTYSGNNYLRGFSMYFRNGTIFTNYQIKPMLIYGATPPTEFKQYKEYSSIDLSNYQTLEGYGLGINENCYNYLDFDKDVLVDRVVYEKLDSTATVTVSSSVAVRLNVDAPVITDTTNFISNYNIIFINGSYAYIPLTEFTGTTADAIKAELGTKPLELVHLRKVEVERSLPQINTFIDVSKGDVITFENEYQNAVPSEIEYVEVD